MFAAYFLRTNKNKMEKNVEMLNLNSMLLVKYITRNNAEEKLRPDETLIVPGLSDQRQVCT
jgi:hypothetical protein